MTGKKRSPVPGGDLELALLSTLWNRGGEEMTARALHDQVGRARGIVYTTVAKVLDRLVDKRMVGRHRFGRAYTYYARIKRQETHHALACHLIEKLTGGEPQPAVAALLGALEEVSPELLDALAAEIQRRKDADHGA